MIKTIFFITFIFVVSCANKPSPEPSKTYSAEVEKDFREIERERAIELYKKLRWQNRRGYKKPTRSTRKVTRPKPTPKKVTPKKEYVRPPLSEEAVEELKIEISQNIVYFCMEKRKDKRFPTENECHAFTQNIIDSCQDRVATPWVDRKIINCVKSQLH